MKRYYEGQSSADLLSLLQRDYLTSSGWLATVEAKEAVDREGRPVPWITYPAFAMLQRLVRPEWSVFEYGAGNSTLWWATQVASVAAIEHDEEWAKSTGAQALSNAFVAHAEGGAYVDAINHAPETSFDVVVVDGESRVECSAALLPRLKPGGLVIFDNSDREEYAAGYQTLEDAGFARIDFWGLGPINPYGWCTSFFVRDLSIFASRTR